MGRNIHAIRIILKGDNVHLHALSESRRGTRYIKDSLVISRKGLSKSETQAEIERGIERLQVVPLRPGL